MFKFGFGDNDDGDGGTTNSPAPLPASSQPAERSRAARIIKPTTVAADELAERDVVELCGGDVLFRKVVAVAPDELAPGGEDIVPAAYEGGFKLWECAADLVEYMHGELRDRMRGASVLELGAGHAFPAVLAAQCGAATVDVQDYNEEVLVKVSAPNMIANVDPEEMPDVRYIVGHWDGVEDVIGGRQYDVILSTDTVYATEQVHSLARCVLAVLAPGGVALVAGKTYYFGVGGGMREFEKAVKEAADSRKMSVDVSVARTIRDGFSNVREIMSIRIVDEDHGEP